MKKNIQQSSSLAEVLRRVRDKRNVTCEDVANQTGIDEQHLFDIESGNYDNLPSPVYIRNYLRLYSEYLNIQTDEILELFEKEYKMFEKLKKNESLGMNHKVRKSIINPTFFRVVLVVVVVLAILGYLGYEVKKIIDPPLLEIYAPMDNLVVEEKLVTIEGKTENEVDLTINDQRVILNNGGYFYEEVNLQEGLNVIKIIARKKHSKAKEIYRNVLVLKTQDE